MPRREPLFDEILVEPDVLREEDLWDLLRTIRAACSQRAVVTFMEPDNALLSMLPIAHFRTIEQDAGKKRVRCVPVNFRTRPASCSVVVPCRNEVDNVGALIRRVPAMGTSTEIVFVDGASTDGTPEAVERLIEDHPGYPIRLVRQAQANGKASAVFEGFDAASGDMVMILDADMTVPPELLPRFYLALAEGAGRFANGSRFVEPMEAGAMPAANKIGNRVFARSISTVIGQELTDTLCGTKALWRDDWVRLKAVLPLFGNHDPWGDFDLLLGAAYLGLEIVEVPIPYAARIAGESKMNAFRDGPVLLKTVVTGARRVRSRHVEESRSQA